MKIVCLAAMCKLGFKQKKQNPNTKTKEKEA